MFTHVRRAQHAARDGQNGPVSSQAPNVDTHTETPGCQWEWYLGEIASVGRLGIDARAHACRA